MIVSGVEARQEEVSLHTKNIINPRCLCSPAAQPILYSILQLLSLNTNRIQFCAFTDGNVDKV